MIITRCKWIHRLGLPALGLATALGSLACSGGNVREDGAVHGQFVETIARYDDGTSKVSYSLRVEGDKQDVRELVFATAPDLLTLSNVKVWGAERNGRIAVERYEPVAENPGTAQGVGKRKQALINAPPIPTTNMVMVMVDLGSGTGDVTVEGLTQDLFGDDPGSLKNYYLENSFGMHGLTGQVMPQVYQFSMSSCNTRELADALRDQVHQDAGVAEFDLYLWYFARTSICSWSGLSGGEDTFYNGSSGCVVLAQEPGHSFGLAHSSSLECEDGGNVVPILDDPNGCTHNEYGNRYDTMGGGCRHFSAYQKTYRTYLQKCNGVSVHSSGTFTLHPIETACDATQVLQVPMPKVRPLDSSGGGGGDRVTELAHYLVELRTPTGFDSNMVPSVLINAAPDYRFYNPSGGRSNRGEHIWLLDMAPGVEGSGRNSDGTPHALAVGQTFTDPAGGVSITTESVSATSATIRVEIEGGSGEPTCLDGTPTTAPGPASCGTGGTGAGTGGTGGAGGTGGDAGSGGAAGAPGGNGGSAGTEVAAGGASGSSGTTGSAGVAGTGGSDLNDSPNLALDEKGGCACRVPSNGAGGKGGGSAALMALALALLWRARQDC